MKNCEELEGVQREEEEEEVVVEKKETKRAGTLLDTNGTSWLARNGIWQLVSILSSRTSKQSKQTRAPSPPVHLISRLFLGTLLHYKLGTKCTMK